MADVFDFIFGIVLGAAIMGIISIPFQPQTITTTTYTLEDGTVLHNCDDRFQYQNCGLSLYDCDERGVNYQCQKNVKITTETKDKCGE